MIKNSDYLVVLKRASGSATLFVPSLTNPESHTCFDTEIFVEKLRLWANSKNIKLTVAFRSKPSPFGIVGIKCDLAAVCAIRNMSEVAMVLPIHRHCIEDPWDLFSYLEDIPTRQAFAEIRNYRREQLFIESIWAREIKGSLRKHCIDFLRFDYSSEKFSVQLNKLSTYLGLSIEQTCQYLLLDPLQVSDEFQAFKDFGVVVRIHALVLLAYQLRLKFKNKLSSAAHFLDDSPTLKFQSQYVSNRDMLFDGGFRNLYDYLNCYS